MADSMTRKMKVARFFYRIKRLALFLTSREHRDFQKYEYPVIKTENETDLMKLRRIKDLDIAKFGFIGTDLKTRLKDAERKDMLISKDSKVVHIAKINILDEKKRVQEILIGRDTESGDYKIASAKSDNVPVWNVFKEENYRSRIASLYPTNSDSLSLEHRSFKHDIDRLAPEERARALDFYKTVLERTYNANTKMKAAVQTISPEAFQLGRYNEKKPILVSGLSDSELIISNSSDSYVTLRPYLEPESDKNLMILSRKEFVRALTDSKIAQLGQSPQGMDIGIRDSRIFVRVGNGLAVDSALKNKWVHMDEFLSDKSYPASLKYDITNNVIKNKNFLNQITAHKFTFRDQSFNVMEHYGTKEKYISHPDMEKNKVNLTNAVPLSVVAKQNPDIVEHYERSLAPGKNVKESNKLKV